MLAAHLAGLGKGTIIEWSVNVMVLAVLLVLMLVFVASLVL